MELAASLEPISPFSLPSITAEEVKPILPPASSNGMVNPLASIDPALLAQLQGLAGSIPGLSDLFAAASKGQETLSTSSNVKVEDLVDRLVEEYDDALRTLNIQLTNVDIARSVLPSPHFTWFRIETNSEVDHDRKRFRSSTVD